MRPSGHGGRASGYPPQNFNLADSYDTKTSKNEIRSIIAGGEKCEKSYNFYKWKDIS
jgi:hypothetical protein